MENGLAEGEEIYKLKGLVMAEETILPIPITRTLSCGLNSMWGSVLYFRGRGQIGRSFLRSICVTTKATPYEEVLAEWQGKLRG